MLSSVAGGVGDAVGVGIIGDAVGVGIIGATSSEQTPDPTPPLE